MSDDLLLRRDGHIATITFNREAKLNALTREMWAELGQAVGALSAEEELRCIVLRGAGTKSFSPGNDIAEFEDKRATVAQARAYGRIMHTTLDALRRCPVPTVAMIHGICVGGGLEIAALCDVRICGEDSRFGAPINRLGLVMGYPEMEGLVRLVGPAKTLELLLEGQIVDAAEALRLGLVSRVVPSGRVEAEALAAAARIAAGAPLVARWHKRFVARLADPRPLTEAEQDEAFACFGTEDFRTGYRAFLEKRTPEFEGR